MIVTGPPAHEEDAWKKIKIGYYSYGVSCRTALCKLSNVNRTIGLEDLASKDKVDDIVRKTEELGMQMCPLFSGGSQAAGSNWNGAGVNSREGRIMVGDEITVEEEGDHWYVQQ